MSVNAYLYVVFEQVGWFHFADLAVGNGLTDIIFHAIPKVSCSYFVVTAISTLVSAQFMCGCDDPWSEDLGRIASSVLPLWSTFILNMLSLSAIILCFLEFFRLTMDWSRSWSSLSFAGSSESRTFSAFMISYHLSDILKMFLTLICRSSSFRVNCSCSTDLAQLMTIFTSAFFFRIIGSVLCRGVSCS